MKGKPWRNVDVFHSSSSSSFVTWRKQNCQRDIAILSVAGKFTERITMSIFTNPSGIFEKYDGILNIWSWNSRSEFWKSKNVSWNWRLLERKLVIPPHLGDPRDIQYPSRICQIILLCDMKWRENAKWFTQVKNCSRTRDASSPHSQ